MVGEAVGEPVRIFDMLHFGSGRNGVDVIRRDREFIEAASVAF